jgi:hypothetical protein
MTTSNSSSPHFPNPLALAFTSFRDGFSYTTQGIGHRRLQFEQWLTASKPTQDKYNR